jgi:transposase
MAKKGQKFTKYTPKLKAEAVRLYEEEKLGYRAIAKMLGLKNHKQVMDWVAKRQDTGSFEDMRGKHSAIRRGRPRVRFKSIEEELAYVKAERDYLKKQYPNLHREVCPRKNGSK